ncbi:solute carrier organic anion transporter family member 2A1-like [Liolophura sinensis]|uniref:solute carrier organic anion transporter family member 2A1-like n=1 Tax=Liolophura sinensis TaxID=3198878 RepID=UPI003158ED82
MGVYDVMTEEPSDATRNQHFLCKEGNAEKPKDRDTSLTSWRGRCLTSMVPFTIYYGVVSLVTSALGAYLTSQITTIEKQFGLSSAQSGLLLSMNDIGFLIMVVFVSYFGRNAHIPKILSLCCFLYGISALVCTVPHLVTENSLAITGSAEAPQNINSPEEGQLCSAPNLSQNRDECESNQSSANSFVKIVAMTLISFGMLLQGVVKSPRSPLVQTYVDDNVSRTSSGLYISIILAMGIFGPALSFGIGGYISKIYVTLEETSLTPRDPRWVGAWWLGFLEFGILGVILAIPVFFFPKRLSNAPPKYQTISSPPEEKQKEGLLSAIWRLLRRPVYVLVVFGSGLRVFTFAGIVAFQPKYLQVYYGLSIFKANVIVGFMSVGSAAVGIIIGGIIIHKLALEIRGMLKMVIITQAVSSLLFTAGIFLVCPQPEIHDFDLNG